MRGSTTGLAIDMRSAIACALGCVGVAVSAVLGGCGLVAENAGSMFVSPGKYDFYPCAQLAAAGRTLSLRENELVELMARAAQGPAGEFVGAVSYRTELLQVRGDLKQVAEVSAQKNCASQSKWQSERALW